MYTLTEGMSLMTGSWIVRMVVCWLVLGLAALAAAHEPVVPLTGGEVRGKHVVVYVNGTAYSLSEYRGIPYAQPPVGGLRFRKPQKMGPLGVFYAKYFGPSCIQLTSGILPDKYVNQSEDCLTLNVYVPARPSDSLTGRAVLVWIHGGGFVERSSESYNASYLAAMGNIIVVTFNYRMNVFGFISASDDSAKGNFGLWDQRLVLEWVQENIGSFGGDRNRVTIGGESAGGTSCLLQAMPMNHGMFQNMIVQSAASLHMYQVGRNGMSEVLKLASAVGCPTDSSTNEEIVQCLRGISADELIDVVKANNLSFYPIIDQEFLDVDPKYFHEASTEYLINKFHFFQSLNVLSGFNSHDGAKTWLLWLGPDGMENFEPSFDDFDSYLQRLAGSYQHKTYPEELQALIKSEYTNWSSPYDYSTIRLQLTKLAGDMLYGVPAMEVLHMHQMSSAAARHFLYHFEAEPSLHFLDTQSWISGANHADELRYVFGMETFMPNEDPNTNPEIILSLNMINYWTTFVKSGDPNPTTSASPLPHWPAYDVQNQDYIKLEKNLTHESIQQYLYAREANFWLKVLPGLEKAVQGTGVSTPCRTSAASVPQALGASTLLALLIMVF